MKNAAAKISRMRNKAKYWIDQIGLKPHPEGGHFKEVYRSDELIIKNDLPERYAGDRPFSTSIYFLLQQGEISGFHCIKSDETWYFHDGDELELFIIDSAGSLIRKVLGINPETESVPQITIERGNWFAARSLGEFTLVGCNVSPGFDFEDFEMADFATMARQYPQHEQILTKFCHH